MIDFLIDFGISNSTVESLKNNNSDSVLYSLKTNELEIEKILNYFREIGITDIDELLIHQMEVFFKTYREIKNVFSRYDLLQLVAFINDDISNIGLLFKSN